MTEGPGKPARDEDLLTTLRAELMGRQPDDRPALAVMQAFEVLERAIRAEATTEAEDASRLGTDLLREVAHMLQAPLGSIMMLVEVLREGAATVPVERRDRQLAIIHMAALGLSTLAGDLLTLVDERSPCGPTGPLDLEESLDSVADILRPVAQVHECQLVVDAPEDPIRVGPGLDLRRALLGLALRAALRIRGGEISIRAEVEDADYVTFSVTANGTDICSQPPDRLFEIFRPDPGAGSYTLSVDGLGLTATAQLIASLGSRLRIDQDQGRGLRLSFRVLLPQHDGGGHAAPPAPPGESRRLAPRRLEERRVRS